ncbi:MAG: oligosaccharide flippase family protein [Spirochaetales bacterium]|nr:oligosaccharide flippase family protein [Spirochaetales bacterium]
MARNILNRLINNPFIGHSKNYLIGEIFNNAIVFMTIPIFTRLLVPDDYGLLSVFTSLISIFSVIFGLNIHSSAARKYYEKDGEFKNFLGTNLIFLVIFNIILITILFFLKDSIAVFFSVDSNLFFIAVIVSSFTFFTLLQLSYFRASQKSLSYAILSIIKNLAITVIAIAWIYYLPENKYLGKIYAQLIVTAVFFIIFIVNLFRLSSLSFNVKHLKYSLLFGIPLIPHTLSGYILAHFDKIIINQISGSHDTGLYSFAYNIGMLLNVVIIATSKAWSPIFFQQLRSNKYDKIQSMSDKYSKVIFAIALLLVLFSNEAVKIMADEKYYSAFGIIPIIILGYVFTFLYTLFFQYAACRKKTWLISIFTFIAGGTNISLNYIFIPYFGYVAAAWTTLASYILLFILHYINSKFILKEKVITMKHIFIDLAILISCVILYFYIPIEISFIQISIKVFLFLGYCIIIFRKYLLKIIMRKS